MCTNVTPSSDTPGELLIGLSNIYFVADEAIMDANYTQVRTDIAWQYCAVQHGVGGEVYS